MDGRTSTETNPGNTSAKNFNQGAEKTGNEAASRLKAGSLYTGIVTATYPSNYSCDVDIDDPSVSLGGCLLMSQYISFSVGLTHVPFPEVGAHVLVAYADKGVVIGTIPSEKRDSYMGAYVRMLQSGITRGDIPNVYPLNAMSNDGNGHPSDLFEGEVDLTNHLNIGVQFLMTLCRMTASSRAFLECCVLNDMVRIVSRTFKHFSSVGNDEIYDTGRLDYISSYTSYRHEAEGSTDPETPRIQFSDTNPDMEGMDRFLDTGRWRYKKFLGFLGDFVHEFIMDPPKVLGTYSRENIQSGKSRVHKNADGTVLIQSVREVALERVSRIIVPVQTSRMEDSRYMVEKMYKDLDKKFLQQWEPYKKPEDAFQVAYQLREYARYLSSFHSMARFLQVESKTGGFYVPSEEETPEPQMNCDEQDKEQANASESEYIQTYSTIRLMYDGSIVVFDGYGSSVMLSNGNVDINSARHMTLEASGDLTLRAGANMYLQAHRSMQIAAMTGGIVMKARTWFHALCEIGTLWLKSDKKPNSKASEGEDIDPIDLGPGVLLDAAEHYAQVHGNKGVMVDTDRAFTDQDGNEREEGLILESTGGDLYMSSNRSLVAEVTQKILMTCRDNIAFRTAASFCVQATRFLYGEVMEITGGAAKFVCQVFTTSLRSSGTVSAGHTLEQLSASNKHDGHVHSGSDEPPEISQTASDVIEDMSEELLPDSSVPLSMMETTSFEFVEDSQGYIWDEKERRFCESLTSNWWRDAKDGENEYPSWKTAYDVQHILLSDPSRKLMQATRTSATSYAFPGKQQSFYTTRGATSLSELSPVKPSSIKAKPNRAVNIPLELTIIKLPEQS